MKKTDRNYDVGLNICGQSEETTDEAVAILKSKRSNTGHTKNFVSKKRKG